MKQLEIKNEELGIDSDAATFCGYWTIDRVIWMQRHVAPKLRKGEAR